MSAAKILAEGCRVFSTDLLADQAPSFGKVADGTGQFEVVDINDQKQPKAFVEVTRAPCGNFSEPNLREVIMAVFFPVPS
jgi:hypothetical protein